MRGDDPVAAQITYEQMLAKKLASCPVCNDLNDYSGLKFNDWTHCTKCNTPMVLVKIDEVVLFFRHGWT